MISYVIALILEVLILYVGILFESNALLGLDLVIALFVVFSFGHLIYRKKRVRVSVNVPIMLAERERPTSIVVEAYNSTQLEIKKIRVCIMYGNERTKTTKKKWLTITEIPQGKSTHEFKVTIDKAGYFGFSVKKAHIYDMTGLFYFSKGSKGGSYALVLPEIKTLPVRLGETVVNFFGDADLYDELRPGYDPSEVFDVREFRPGDKIQSVHWKLSAKMDQLVVRENSLPKACPVTLLIDPSDLAKFDEQSFYEMAIGLSFSLMDSRCPHYVAWRSMERQDIIRTRVDGEESFFMFATRFMQDCLPRVEEEYDNKYRRDTLVHKLILMGDGRLILDGEDLGKPSFENFELIL